LKKYFLVLFFIFIIIKMNHPCFLKKERLYKPNIIKIDDPILKKFRLETEPVKVKNLLNDSVDLSIQQLAEYTKNKSTFDLVLKDVVKKVLYKDRSDIVEYLDSYVNMKEKWSSILTTEEFKKHVRTPEEHMRILNNHCK
jgi:hypothetical protein